MRRCQAELVEAGAVGSAALSHCVVGGDPDDFTAAATCPRSNRRGKAAGGSEMDRGRRCKLVQRPAGKPAAEDSIEGGCETDQPLSNRQLRGVSRIDSDKQPPEIVKRGRWRNRAHGDFPNVHVLF